MSEDIIPQQVIVLVTIIIGLIGLYLSSIPFIGIIFSILVTLTAVLLGTNTLRHVGKYSLGTGVPSIVYLLTSIGVIGSITGLTVSIILNNNWLSPIIGLLVTAFVGYCIGIICKYIFNMNIKILTKSLVEIAIASMLAVSGLSTIISMTFIPSSILNMVVKNGFIVLILISVIMAIQNPYNSCMGPNEDQIRTLTLAVSNAFLIITLISFISIISNNYWYFGVIIGVIGWILSFRKFIQYSMLQAASVRWYGLWPKDDKEGKI